MMLGGKTYCEYCGQEIFFLDGVTVKISFNGFTVKADYHSRTQFDCIDSELTILEQSPTENITF